LIVQDFVNWAKQNRIVVGPGRGSAGGSIVAYLSGINSGDQILPTLNSLDGVKALLLLHQQTNGLIKGSLRTNDDLIDVSKLAIDLASKIVGASLQDDARAKAVIDQFIKDLESAGGKR
jgi:hypothetical protein